MKSVDKYVSHQALHSREAQNASGEVKSKNQKETEAESVAYVVCQHYGIDTSDYSFAYVATWSADKEVPELKASLDTIRRTASELITKIDEKVQARAAVKEVDQFIDAHAEDLPFDNPGDDTSGFIKIEPQVDLKNSLTFWGTNVTMN